MNYVLDEIPRGQLNNVILATMLDGEKYGYEIIDEIEKWSGGKIKLKQPSLYSALNRMETSELLSSFWRDSEIGGKRHYYRLTDLGYKTASGFAKKFLEEKEETGTILDQKNMFGLLKKEEEKPEEKPVEEKNDLQFNMFESLPKAQDKNEIKKQQIQTKLKNIKNNDNLVQLKQYTEADRKSEFENLKLQHKNLSFNANENKNVELNKKEENTPKLSDVLIKNELNQEKPIDFSAKTEKVENKELQEKVVEEEKLKQTFDISKYQSARDGYFLDGNSSKTEEVKEEKQEPKDYSNLKSGIFLDNSERIEPTKPTKIEPYNLNIEIASPKESITFRNLKNEQKIEEEKPKESLKNTTFSSFLGLKNYYSHQGIALSEYKKTDDVYKQQNVNMWLLNTLRATFILFVSIILSLGFGLGLKQNFYGKIAFILIPAGIALIAVSYFLIYLYEKRSKKIKFLALDVNNTLKNIMFVVCFDVLIIAINLFLGFSAITGIYYFPTLIYPIILMCFVGASEAINMLICKIFKLK